MPRDQDAQLRNWSTQIFEIRSWSVAMTAVVTIKEATSAMERVLGVRTPKAGGKAVGAGGARGMGPSESTEALMPTPASSCRTARARGLAAVSSGAGVFSNPRTSSHQARPTGGCFCFCSLRRHNLPRPRTSRAGMAV